MPDVVIVGGGISGLVAARELTASGLDVTVLEGASRWGGRIRTVDSALGVPLELGATWVHWSHPHVWAEMTRYGLAYVPDPAPLRRFTRAGGRTLVEVSPESYDERLERVLRRLFDPCMPLFSEPFAVDVTTAAFAEFDRHTIASWMDFVGLDDADRDFVSGYLVALTGVPAHRAGIATFAHWWSFGGGTFDGFVRTFEGGRIGGGMSRLVDAVAADAGNDLRLSSRVVSLVETDDTVAVTTADGETLECRAVVVATPLNTWHGIDFRPALPESAVAASRARAGGASGGHAVLATVEGDAESFVATQREAETVSMLFTFSRSDAGHVVKAYGNGTERRPTGADMQAVLDELGTGLRITETFTHDWCADPLVGGAWTYRSAGMLSSAAPLFGLSHGRTYFSSADISTGLNWVDGAIADALRTSSLVTASLR